MKVINTKNLPGEWINTKGLSISPDLEMFFKQVRLASPDSKLLYWKAGVYFQNHIVCDASGVQGFNIQSKVFDSFYFLATDPRVKGGTYSVGNLIYINDFFLQMSKDKKKCPLILYLNTGGVRVTQPRRIFSPVFRLLPELAEIAKTRLVVCMATQKCLGIGALFFGTGHFRIVAGPKTILNLTGPQVISQSMTESEKFESYASAESQLKKNHLIHEVVENSQVAFQRLLDILTLKKNFQSASSLNTAMKSIENCGESDLSNKEKTFLSSIGPLSLEIFPQLSSKWKSFLVLHPKGLIGVIAHPLLNPDNLIGVAELHRAIEALKLFSALQIPLLSAIDSPGGDPRKLATDQDIVLESVDLATKLYEYPFKKMGLIMARCYGGAGLFSLMKVHKSEALYGLKSSRIGIMSEGIIESLISKSSSLTEEWQKTKAEHLDEMADMVATKNIDGMIELKDLSEVIGKTLFKR